MIDPITEDLLVPREATRYFPRGPTGKPLHVAAIYRYMSAGVGGIILESINCPRKCTSRQAVARFLVRLTDRSRVARPTSRQEVACERPNSDIERELDRLGI
jgi:hypothetical protein